MAMGKTRGGRGSLIVVRCSVVADDGCDWTAGILACNAVGSAASKPPDLRSAKLFVVADGGRDWNAERPACVSAKHEKGRANPRSLTPRKPRRCRQGCPRSSRVRRLPPTTNNKHPPI